MRRNQVRVRRVPAKLLEVEQSLRRIRPNYRKHWRRKVVSHVHTKI